MRTIIVTAANERFMPLLRGLIGSLRQWEPSPFSELAVFDVGLAAESLAWVRGQAGHVIQPDWDLPVDPNLQLEKPELRAHTVRPFLPKYIPGYDIYLWIDADAWVQERFALDWYTAVAAQGALAAALHVDRAYRHTKEMIDWRRQRMRNYFGTEAESRLTWDRYVNSGAFALRSDAPHWALWAKWFQIGLQTAKGQFCSDQTALNYALWTERLRVAPLPALCNWLCHLALPHFDVRRARFCEPLIPGHPIGIMHLTAGTKDLLLDPPGGPGIRKISLRFPG